MLVPIHTLIQVIDIVINVDENVGLYIAIKHFWSVKLQQKFWLYKPSTDSFLCFLYLFRKFCKCVSSRSNI